MLIKFNGHKLELYDSIQDLPITRFQKYNLNVLIDSGIGSTVQDVTKKVTYLRHLIKNRPELAAKELLNIEQNITFVVAQTNPKMNSFVCLLKSMDGEEIAEDRLSEDGIKEILQRLSEKKTPYSVIKNALNEVKKKFALEFDFLLNNSVDVETKKYYNQLRKRSLLILAKVQNSSLQIANQLKIIDDFFLEKLAPKNYHGADGVEVQNIKGFEQTCIIIEQYKMSSNAKGMTTLAFYQALEMIKEQLKKQKK